MNWWETHKVVQGAGWTLVHFLWEGMVIATALAVALRVLGRKPAQWRYVAGCAAMALMAIAPLCTFQLVTARFAPQPAPLTEINTPELATEKSTADAPRSTLPPKIVVVSSDGAQEKKTSWTIETIFPWLVGVWAAGVVLLSGRLFVGWWQISKWKRNATGELPEFLRAKGAELARRLGISRSVRLLKSAVVEVPTVIGWLRPVILLPAGCLVGLSAQQLEAILAHELAHIRRHDYLVNLLQSAVETLLFYHPAVWWVSARVREERENCCDDLAVEVNGDPVSYARALATLEELRPASAQLALAASGAPLLRRVQRLLGRPQEQSARPAWPVAALVVVLLAAMLATANRRAAAHEPIKKAAPLVPAPAMAVSNQVQESKSAPEVFTGGAAVSEGPKSGMFDWSVQGRGELNRQWFWYRVGDTGADQQSAETTDVEQAVTYESNKIEAATLVQEGKALLEAGRPDEAESRLRQAVMLDPSNVAAYQYLKLVDEKRVANTTMPPRPIVFNQPSGVYTGKGRQAIVSKLEQTHVDSVKYPGIELKEVLNDLARIAKNADPEGKGINFIVNREIGAASGVPDPATGLVTAGEPPDVSDVKIQVSLEDVRLVDILDAITRSADRPIKYSILDYAVIFSARTGETVALETRTFHIDPNTFQQGLQGVIGIPFGATGGTSNGGGGTLVPQVSVTGGIPGGGGGGGANGGLRFVTSQGTNTDALQGLVRSFFAASGVDLETNSGKAVFFNDRNGKLTVRATAQDLALIETAVHSLNKPLPNINIKAKLVLIPAGGFGAHDLKAIEERTAGQPMDLKFESLTTTPPAGSNTQDVGLFSGIMGATLYHELLTGLEKQDGIEVLTSPEITTESGREAMVQIMEPKNIRFPKGPNNAQTPEQLAVPLGPSLEVLATASADEFSVRITVTPTVTEFVGYEKGEQYIPSAALKSGVVLTSTLPMPVFRIRKATTTATVWDGQTLVFGGLTASNAVFIPSGKMRTNTVFAPSGGSSTPQGVPVAEGSFQATSPVTNNSSNEKPMALMIFITPTLINPDGTRYHKDEEMPMNQKGTNAPAAPRR